MLAQLPGYDSFKKEIEDKVSDIRMEKNRGGNMGRFFDNYLFMGDSVADMSTAARMMAEILFAEGMLSTDKVVTVSRADLVGSYVGMSKTLVNNTFQKANGGVLFIDNAHSLKLGDNDYFGKEAMDAIIANLDEAKGCVVCIATGSSSEMQQWLESDMRIALRFNKTIVFGE